jgi:hypothetical protein
MSDRLIAAGDAEPPELVVGPERAGVRSTLAADIAQTLDRLPRTSMTRAWRPS